MRDVWRFFWVCASVCLLSACATPNPQRSDHNAPWQGRLSLVVHSTPAQQLSASFALSGSAQQGQLDFYSPLGSTTASLRWSEHQADWLHDGKSESFANLSQLTEKATGTALPVSALFDWLQGRNTPAEGWRVDLSQIQQGKINAQRTQPLPEVSLRLLLD
jgi:outer membrane lipoprotein LolB